MEKEINIAEMVVSYRARHNLSMREMAEKCGVTLQTIQNIEVGRFKPQRLTIAKIKNLIEDEVL